MERRRPTSLALDLIATPENYIRAVVSLSRRYSSTSVFPGNNYVDIGEWLLQGRRLPNMAKSGKDAVLFASECEEPHDLVVVYESKEGKWGVQQYSQEQHEALATASSVSPGGSCQMVFIRGFISPAWVSVIGNRYSIDPEFFRRHMDYLSVNTDRHAYSLPSLASSSNNIFRLCVSTLLHRDGFGGQDLPSQRLNQSAELRAYKMRQLRTTKVRCGDSLVREYSTVCSCFSVIEQWISICIAKTDRGWAVIVWMDHGRPLEKSPPGPWTSQIESKATPLAILQHHPKMAFRATKSRLNSDANATAEFQQSTALLPLQYDSLIALVGLAHRAPQDPLSISIPLFAHAAFSEVQFLNVMESRIQMQINSVVAGVQADGLENLQYFTNILHRHAQQLKDSTRALHKLAERSTRMRNWLNGENSMSTNPAPPDRGISRHVQTQETEASSSDGPFTAKGLLEDYEQLHARCIGLSQMCTQGITLAMNKATIEESRKAIEQSERVKKLTLLATLFIPLSFSSSLLSMNIDIFGSNGVRPWWFFVLCIPITLMAYIFYLWDTRFLRQCWVRFWNGCGISRHLRAGRREKDANDLA